MVWLGPTEVCEWPNDCGICSGGADCARRPARNRAGIVQYRPAQARTLTAVELQPDPRISSLRPAWLTDDDAWRDQLQALDLDDDIRWIERHWAAAGGADSTVDTSWVRTELVGDVGMWFVPAFVAVLVLVIMVIRAATQ